MMNEFKPDDFTKERSLWQVYVASRGIPSSRFNRWSVFVVASLLVMQVWFFGPSHSMRTELIRELASSGLTVVLSTLGLLLAGYTIFATISQPGLMVMMGRMERDHTGLSYLKYNMFVFLRVLCYYLVFAVLCLIVVLFCAPGGAVVGLIEMLDDSESVKSSVSAIGFTFMGAASFYLILLLKSFIFNVYHSVMTSLRWQAESSDCSDHQ